MGPKGNGRVLPATVPLRQPLGPLQDLEQILETDVLDLGGRPIKFDGGVDVPIHSSAWKDNSKKVALRGFSEGYTCRVVYT